MIFFSVRNYKIWNQQLKRISTEQEKRRKFKRQLPTWLRFFELFLFPICFIAIFSGILDTTVLIHHLLHNDVNGFPTAAFLAVGSLVIAFPLGFMVGNIVSWLTPAARRANETAMKGTTISYGKYQSDFFHMLSWVGPAGLVMIFLGLAF